MNCFEGESFSTRSPPTDNSTCVLADNIDGVKWRNVEGHGRCHTATSRTITWGGRSQEERRPDRTKAASNEK